MLRFAEVIVVLAENAKDLENILNGIDEPLRKEYGLKINLSKTKVMKCCRDDDISSLNIKIGDALMEEVYKFTYLGSIITNDGRSKCAIKSRLAQVKQAFYQKRTFLTTNLNLVLRNFFLKQYVWSTALYGSETWILGLQETRCVEFNL